MPCKNEERFFFILFPDNRDEPDDDEETGGTESEKKLKRFNPFELIGAVSAHYGYDFDYVLHSISFQQLTLLNASIPKINRYKGKTQTEEKPKDLNSILSAHVNKK